MTVHRKIEFSCKPAIVRWSDSGRTRRHNRALDAGGTRGVKQSRCAGDIGLQEQTAIIRRKRIQRGTMHEKATALHRTRKRARVQEIAFDGLDFLGRLRRTRHDIDGIGWANEGAHAVARRNKCARDVTADEACGPGQKDEVT